MTVDMKPSTYYDVVYSGKYHVDEARIRHMVAFCKGRVLDVGCGDGTLTREWEGEYLGIDFSSKAIGLCSKGNRDQHFICLDFLTESLPNGPWNTIVLGEVLEHLTPEAGTSLLTRCTEVLADDGRIIISVPNGDMIPDEAHVRTFTETDFPDGAIVNTFGSYLVAVIDHDRPKLSVVLIVKNEEPMLEGCLKSLESVWDELVVVDTGSTDKTIEIARSFGARIGHFEWCDDSGAARAYAETLCLGEWIFWQDGDEILLEGKDVIRKHLDNPELSAVRPQLVFDKDNNGRPTQVFFRQELLHRNNGWRWHGAAHPYFTGTGRVITDSRIRQEHLPRPGGDRPNFKSSLDAMRKNLGSKFEQRHLYYLARQHWYSAHYQEAIALVDLLLAQPSHWDVERSSAAIIKGDCYRALKMLNESRLAYLQAVREYGKWAEPYYCLGRCEYERKNWTEGAAWFYASLPWSPPDYFVDMSIYDWRRYDMLSVCLYRMGKSKEAIHWNKLALAIQPNNERLLTNQRYYERD